MSERGEEHPFIAFRDAFFARKEAFLDVYVARSLEACGTLGMSPEVFRERRSADLDHFMAALTDPEALSLREHMEKRVESAVRRGIPAEIVHALGSVTRRFLLDMGLELRAAGVPRATDAIRRCLDVGSATTRRIDITLRARAEATRREARIFETVIRKAPDAIGVSEPGGRVTQANPAMFAMLRTEDVIGRSLYQFVSPRSIDLIRAEVVPAITARSFWTGPLYYMRGDGTEFEALVTAFIVRDETGKDLARCAILRDLSEAREAEALRQGLVAGVIEAQKQALLEIGTPLVPVAPGVLVMPLIGRLDAARAERMLGVLLEGITSSRAAVVLVDVTGAKGASREAATGLARAAAAARLLGAEVVVTGIGPELARTLVEEDMGFGAIRTKATLGDGVAFALREARGR